MSPSQKYGTAEKKVVIGRIASHRDPRRQPMKAPTNVPMTKLMTVAMPTSAIVQGSDCRMTSATGAGKNENERPRSPCSRLFQYSTYWLHRLRSSSSPNSTYSESIASELSCPWYRLMRDCTGSPGIRRGMTKLSVIAAHAVTR